ncbi:MAG: DUF3343 domain-containing protein [Oscillospiraceae bacterium]|nr:DUF3343 domain-containing protein [Oscillospiraceae bacterium]
MMSYYITFRSVTYAQRGERVLRRGGVDPALQRTPRWMEERGCGYCLRVRPGEALAALELLRAAGVPFSKIYGPNNSGKMEELPL